MDTSERMRRMLEDNAALRQQLEANLAHHRRMLELRALRDEARRADAAATCSGSR